MVSAIDGWIQSERRSRAAVALKRLYELQSTFLFNQYEPVRASSTSAGLPFIDRLDKWILSFDDEEDRWIAFKTFKYFFFAGLEETEEMYRCAVHHQVTRWLVDLAAIDIFSPDANARLQAEFDKLWPCPITDSLRINSLLHRTGLRGQSLRPDWLSLKELGDKTKIARYVGRKGIRYLALFEDFVGSGSQCARAVNFALKAFDGPVLLCPLVVCAPGADEIRNIASQSQGRLTFEPVIELSHDCLVGKDSLPGQPSSFPALRTAMANGYKKIGVSVDGGEFGHGYVGSLYASYSNCPNNSPPIFHITNSSWPDAIFPRKGRS